MRTLNVQLVSSVEIIIAGTSEWMLTHVWTVVLQQEMFEDDIENLSKYISASPALDINVDILEAV